MLFTDHRNTDLYLKPIPYVDGGKPNYGKSVINIWLATLYKSVTVGYTWWSNISKQEILQIRFGHVGFVFRSLTWTVRAINNYDKY